MLLLLLLLEQPSGGKKLSARFACKLIAIALELSQVHAVRL